MYYHKEKSNNTNMVIVHSAKGSTWKNHKYIKKINGVYYYAKDKAERAIDEFVWNAGGKEAREFSDASHLYNMTRDANRWASNAAGKKPSNHELAIRRRNENMTRARYESTKRAYEKTPLYKYNTMKSGVKKAVSRTVNSAKKIGSMASKTATNLYKKGSSALKKIFS